METKNTVADGKSQTASAKPNTPATQIETKLETKVEPQPETSKAAATLAALSGLDAILANSKSRKSGGSKIRPNVGYTLITENFVNMNGKSIPGQQQLVLQIIKAALLSPAAIVVNDMPVISEPELNKLVNAAFVNGTLKTRQDAWHIFTYYRTSMKKSVKDGGFAVLKEVDIPLTAAAA